MKKILATTLLLLSMQFSIAGASDLIELGPQALLSQGIAAYQRGQYAEAVKYLSARCRIQPADPKAYYFLGNTYLQLKQNDDAAHMFTACVKTDAASQAGQYSLQALERLSTMPKVQPDDKKKDDGKLTPEQIEASKESMRSDRALDKYFSDSVKRIQNERVAMKRRVDSVYEKLQDDLSQLNRRTTQNYAGELAKTKSEAEIEVERMQKKELRWENRLLAPDKIDVRAVPEIPNKKDDSKDALGALSEYFKPEKPNDPFSTDITPELTAKFMTVRDVFGDLSTYDPNSRRLAQQMFGQLKASIENKQDYFDNQIHQAKQQLVRDIYNINANYPNQVWGRSTLNPLSYLTNTNIPRASQDNMSQFEMDVTQAADRTKRRMKDYQDAYVKDVDLLISGTKERLASTIGQTATANSQMKHPHGVIQIVPLGTNLNTRNYVNFGDRDLTPSTPAPKSKSK